MNASSAEDTQARTEGTGDRVVGGPAPPALEWCSYALEFSASQDGELPAFPGSAIRGAFGHALKRLVCVMRNRPCEGCPLEFSCLYTTLFETRAHPADGPAAVRDIRPPHPFVLKVEFLARRRIHKGDTLRFGLNLYGTAVSASPFVLRAMEEAGERGFGRNRLSFRLEGIRQAGPQDDWSPGRAYPVPAIRDAPQASGISCRWHFATPLRLRSGGRPVDDRRLTPADLAMPVLRRLDLLVRHYGNPGQLRFQPDMKRRAGLLRFTHCELKWKRLQRYSSRQSTTHSVSGLMGDVGLDCSAVPEWGPILAWAPVIHVGKATSMGLGRVETVGS